MIEIIINDTDNNRYASAYPIAALIPNNSPFRIIMRVVLNK